MTLKNILKTVKLNESTISMVLGALVIVVVGILTVNYFKGSDGKIPFGNDNKVEVLESNSEYTVVAGDSLWKLAEKEYGSGYSWLKIAEANNLSSYTLEVGQKLTIPDSSGFTETSVSSEVTSSQDDGTYTVVHGDSLWEIAESQYGSGYEWVKIAEANNLSNPNVIHSGNVLILPR